MLSAASLRTPKYRHHKAKDLAVVTIAGRDIYLGKYGSPDSKRAYRRLVGEYLQYHAAPIQAATVRITVIEVIAAYLKYARDYYRKEGKVTREYGLIVDSCKFVRALYAEVPAIDFGPLALKVVRQLMIDADHSRQYINKNIGRIRRMFKWAASEELIPASIPQSLSMVSGLKRGRTKARETSKISPVDDAVVDATLPHLSEVVADMVRIQRITGMRPQEICLLRPIDLDRSGDVWLYRPESHKTQHHGRERIIFLGEKAIAVLNKYLARDAELYCFRPVESEQKRRAIAHLRRKTPLVCGNVPGSNVKPQPKRKAGNRYNTDSYRHAIHRACDLAFPAVGNLARERHETRKNFLSRLTDEERIALRNWQSARRWSPNRLRHSAATEIRRMFGLEAAQVVLGHAAADVTQVYAERDVQKGIEVARKIG